MQKSSKLNTILLVIVIILLAVGIGAVLSKKKNTDITNYNFPTTADLDQSTTTTMAQPTQPTTTTSSTQSQNQTTWNTYSNAQNSFSFKYPSDWIISENSINNTVKISTKSKTVVGVDNSGNPVAYAPDYSITFTKTDKTFFNQPINTKYGQVTYDEINNRVLIDGECRTVTALATSSIQGVTYGGSLMSTPAYGDSAIVTKNKDIIIVHTEQVDAMTDDLLIQVKTIMDSFTLLNNKIITQSCS